MNKFTLIFFFSLFSTLVYAGSGKIEISGQVLNQSNAEIKITYLDSKTLISDELDNHGNFNMSVKIQDGFYFLKYGRKTLLVYLYPKDKLMLSFDAKDIENTLVFEGKGSSKNNYLIKKSILDSEFTQDLEAFYKVNEETYLENINIVKNKHLEHLSNYDVEKYFIKAETKSIEYERLLSIQNYKSNFKFYFGEEIRPSLEFYEPIEDVDIFDEKEYIKQPYFRYLVNSIWSQRIKTAPDVNEMLNVLRRVPSQDMAISLINGLYSKISSNNERAKDYLELIKRVTSHQPFIEAAEKRYEEATNPKGLKKGDNSPEFSYENYAGEIMSLSDFRGKYVYIDIWATWCGPCIKQIPYLKELEEYYQNKNIVFVSISVDKVAAKDSWKQMILDKNLGGFQLFSDKSFDSDFIMAYVVNSIPRFILIDPDGKIINTEAPRPSFNKTRELLDSLLN